MSTWNPNDAINGLMDRFARPCICIHRPFPPPRQQSGRSKLGGLPNLPPDIEWPYGRSNQRTKPRRTPLHFMAQIDCSELPRCGNVLPTTGMLYFFANMTDDADWYGHPADDLRRVLYAPQVAADQPVRQPPPDMPDIGPRTTIRGFPHGYSDGHFPDDPLTGKIYFEWPLQFAVIDSYPATDAIRETTDWAQLAAFLTARANADKSFMEEWGDGDECLLTGYGESYRDRMRNASWKALNIPDRQGTWEPPPSKRWRQINDDMRGSFPPTATFASEIAAAIEYYMGEKTEWVERQRERDARRAAQAGRQQGGGIFRRWFGSGSSPPDPAPPPQPVPDDVEDFRIVRQEAVAWLRRTRALAPGDALDNGMREQFLAWLDDLHDRNWMRIDGHKPQTVDGVGYVFDDAMFNLARLSASREDIRAHFPEELYQTYLTAGYEGGAWHQMLGWFHGSQEPKPIDDTKVPLLMLSYDACPDFRICDVGEMQFFIREGDLRAKDFSSVEVQMQGG